MLLEAQGVGIPEANGQTPLAGPIQLSVAAGDRILLTGPSGSGKSTLLRCLALLESRTHGVITYRGESMSGDRVPRFRTQVVYVPQTAPRFPMLVEDSLRMAFQFASQQASYCKAEVIEGLESLALPRAILGRELAHVSGGELQRISLLRALLIHPKILLLDEVTSALDSESESQVIRTLQNWYEAHGSAGIAISHGARTWNGAENRVLHMRDGQLSEVT